MRYTHNKFILFCLLCLIFWGGAALANDDSVLKVDVFGALERPLSAFDHDQHQELVDECADCHHVYEDGKLVEGESSEDQACSDCHTLKAQGNQPGLRTAFHQQCQGCHVEKKSGPVACGQCHVK